VIVCHIAEPGSPASEEQTREALAGLARTAEMNGAVLRVIRADQKARELQRISEEATTGVIVMGSTSQATLGRLLVGGVGERLLGSAGCPVAIAPGGYGASADGDFKRIGIAFDGSDDARHALDAAKQLARTSGAVVEVTTVAGSAAFGGTTTAGAFGQGTANQILRDEARRTLDEALEGAPQGLEMDGRLLVGDPSEVLAEASRRFDLLVTGSRGFGPRGAVLLGSTTNVLMRTAQCPVLITPRGTAWSFAA
jgi:nucleotide-binding universal stress UspA family protein